MRVLAIDQGTTNTKALLIDDQGRILARASAPLTTSYPHPGWAEQSAADIWASVQSVIARIVVDTGPQIDAVAIANQRETLVAWDSQTSAPICPAPIWQCRRTAKASASLIAAGHDPSSSPAPALASTRCSRRESGLGAGPCPRRARPADAGTAADGHGGQLAFVEPDRRRDFRHRPFQCQPHPALRYRNAGLLA
jgi:hypothetical protein